MAVFAVWEPILPTDWKPPITSVLHRLSDNRVRQFWDADHMVAAVLKKAESAGNLHPACCERKGFPWDLAGAYPPGAQWQESPPQPIVFNGTVVKTAPELESAITNMTALAAPR